MGLDVFGVLDEGARVDNGRKRLRRKIASV